MLCLLSPGSGFKSDPDSQKLEKTLTQQMLEFPTIDKYEINYIPSPTLKPAQTSSRYENDSQDSEKSKVKAKFMGNYQDDGSSGDFDSQNYPHSSNMMRVSRVIMDLIVYLYILKNK